MKMLCVQERSPNSTNGTTGYGSVLLEACHKLSSSQPSGHIFTDEQTVAGSLLPFAGGERARLPPRLVTRALRSPPRLSRGPRGPGRRATRVLRRPGLARPAPPRSAASSAPFAHAASPSSSSDAWRGPLRSRRPCTEPWRRLRRRRRRRQQWRRRRQWRRRERRQRPVGVSAAADGSGRAVR